MEHDVSKRAIVLGTLIFLSVFSGGCGQPGMVDPPDTERAALRLPTSQPLDSASDEAITSEGIQSVIAERFRLHHALARAPIALVIDENTVVLLGVVPGAFERSFAGRLALDTRGVSRIDNQLSVIEPEAPVTERRVERADTELARDAARALALSRRFAEASVRVAVTRGIARLSGIVESDGDRIYCGELVSGIPGMHGVKNGLIVQPLSPQPPAGA